MNTQSLDLNKMGLAPMQSSEMQEVEGGSVWSFVIEYVAGKLADLAIDDYKSRKGGPGSITARTAAFGPY